MVNIFNAIIRWSFYLLFFLVPLVFYHRSSELFEYNKMMLTYGLTLIIVGAWLGKMVIAKKLIFKRTLLDWAIVFYVASHIISTIWSIDSHTSLWGYYSRFHEGLLATLSYVALYYAFVANLHRVDVLRIILSSFTSGLIVALWGTLEHFGSSPSCVIITNKFDVDCWVQDVRNRVFATMGQPNWMAAYLDVLILTAVGFLGRTEKPTPMLTSTWEEQILYSPWVVYPLLTIFFAGLLFTKSRSGVIGLLVGLALFCGLMLVKNRRAVKPLAKKLLTVGGIFLVFSFFIGLPLPVVDKFSWANLTAQKDVEVAPPKQDLGYIDIGISESGDIRAIVWKGALKVWERYPIFGSGVETFAYAYYLDRPVEHNMVSEWDFLYNKAHNEFLNILATTGTVGMLAYFSLIGSFAFWLLKKLRSSSSLASLRSGPLAASSLIIALFAAYASILVTNFFGFSVVIIGLFFFLIPAFAFLLAKKGDAPQILTSTKSHQQPVESPVSVIQWLLLGVVVAATLYLIWVLRQKWEADENYAWGKNYDSLQTKSAFVAANPYLINAVTQDPSEPSFQDELSNNASALVDDYVKEADGKKEDRAKTLATVKPYVDLAVATSNNAVAMSPNNVVFWKTRARVFNRLSAVDPNYSAYALQAVSKAAELAPTDATIAYNLGVIIGAAGEPKKAIQIMEHATKLKPNYADAFYGLGLYYEQEGDLVKAREQMNYMLTRIGFDERAKKWLDERPEPKY